MEKASSLDRFLALVCREFGATDARLLAPDDVPPDAENSVVCELDDGRNLVVAFAEALVDREVIERRLRILADTFAESLGSAQFRAKRAAAPISLAEELRALASRSNATDVVVIDVDSPVVWGSALGPSISRSEPPPALVSRPQLLSEWEDARDDQDEGHESNANTDSGATLDPDAKTQTNDSTPVALGTTSAVALRAIDHIRTVTELANSAHRGKYVRHSHVDQNFAYLAASFSSIYLLVLVYQGSFDEILAERAAQDAMPRVERLVLALPPLDPEPEPFGQAISMRGRRRR